MNTKHTNPTRQAKRIANVLGALAKELRQVVGEDRVIVMLDATVAVPRRQRPVRQRPEPSER
jgi:hypothetical protein